MTDPRPDQVPPHPRFSLAALLGYVTAVGILCGLVRVATYEFYPGVIRLPAMCAALALYGVLVILLGSVLESILSGPKSR